MGLLRIRLPLLDRLERKLEHRAYKRARRHAAKGDPWRTPDKLWPDFGDD